MLPGSSEKARSRIAARPRGESGGQTQEQFFLTSQEGASELSQGKRVTHSVQPCLGGRISAKQDVPTDS